MDCKTLYRLLSISAPDFDLKSLAHSLALWTGAKDRVAMTLPGSLT